MRHGGLDSADQLEALSLCRTGEELTDILDELTYLELLSDQVQFASLDLRVVEDVVDDLHHRLRGSAHRFDEALLPLVELRPRQELRHAQHAVHRRTDLVAHVGQELVLRSRHRFRCAEPHLELPRPLDDLLPGLETNVAEIPLVLSESVGKRVEVGCKLVELVTAPQSGTLLRPWAPGSDPRCARQLSQGLDDVPLE